MAKYIRKEQIAEVYKHGDPLPEGWPRFVVERLGKEPHAPLWTVKERGGYLTYFDDESFYWDYQPLPMMVTGEPVSDVISLMPGQITWVDDNG